MRLLCKAERSVAHMEKDGSLVPPLGEIEELTEAITGVRWAGEKPEDRDAAQSLLLRLALLKHAAVSGEARKCARPVA